MSAKSHSPYPMMPLKFSSDMQLWRVALLVILLLAVRVQLVGCSDHVEPRSQPQPPGNEDPCNNHTVACIPAGSAGAQFVIDFTSGVSFILFTLPLLRVIDLEHVNRIESDTQFWWHLCCGGAGYFLWVFYFSDCRAYPNSSVFPIYVISILGVIVHCILLGAATHLTLGVRDKRYRVAAGVLLFFFSAGIFMWVFHLKFLGWLAFMMTALSQCFHFGATNHRDNSKFWLCVSVPIWVVNAFISAVGAISSFLWLMHPQLCLSFEYKITSYVNGVIRAVEAYLWCSHGLARCLSKIEGQTVNGV